MVINDDLEYVTGGIYLEIVQGERLVFIWGASDGWPEIATDRPEDGPVVTILLNAVGDKTEMIFQLALPDHLSDDQVREWRATGMREGWSDTLDRLPTSFAVGQRLSPEPSRHSEANVSRPVSYAEETSPASRSSSALRSST